MNFDDPRLVAKFGSWARVQVAFYDFIFQAALELCPEHFRLEAIKDAVTTDGFADGNDYYERAVTTIGQKFKSSDDAWHAFVADSL